MAGWPSLGRVEDHRLAQALRDGDPTAPAETYDLYAPRLFDYAHALLRDQDLAARAVHDSLIATREHIGKLREPDRFRSWLYTIVRNECLRLLADPERPEQRHQAPEQSEDAFLDTEERQRREDTRQLVHSALAGLSPRQREAADLSARHDLSAEELAGVLGTSAHQATELIAQARDGLEDALAAAIVARTGRDDCPSVAALVDEQWPLPPDVCRKLIRHMESCPTCRDRRRRKVSTTRLMQVLPVAAIPPDLRMAVLSLVEAPDRHEHRTMIAQRAEPFDVWGWPTSLDRVRPVRDETRSGTHLWPAFAVAACVVLVVSAIFLLTSGGSGGPKPANDRSPAGVAAGGDDSPSALPSPSDSVEPSPTRTKTPTPTPTPTTHAPTRRPRPTPTRTRKPTPKPPAPGTLVVTGCTITDDKNACDITLTAKGGAVRWNVANAANVSVSDDGGTVVPGRPHHVTATRLNSACPTSTSGSVTFSPGGTAPVSWSCGVTLP